MYELEKESTNWEWMRQIWITLKQRAEWKKQYSYLAKILSC